MQAQVAQGALDDDERNEALAATLQGCDRATRLVAQLLQLARLEALPQHSGVAPCPAPEALVAVLLRNLIDNALRYSPDHACVRVHTQALAGGRSRLTVEDSGPGLSDEHLARLGERFFRVVGTQQSGSGLGWSIVTRVATLYGLNLHLGRSDDLGGLRVDVEWA
jgi:two-component system sensor histidine kinase QseC